MDPPLPHPRPADGALREPVPAHERARWRVAVAELTVLTRGRRLFAPTLHAGAPGGPQESFVPAPAHELDQALRTDLVVALLDRALTHGSAPALWLTRCGELAVHDEDAAWLAATEGASLECELTLPLVIVTRRGWRDPRTGVRREWRRLRQR